MNTKEIATSPTVGKMRDALKNYAEMPFGDMAREALAAFEAEVKGEGKR